MRSTTVYKLQSPNLIHVASFTLFWNPKQDQEKGPKSVQVNKRDLNLEVLIIFCSTGLPLASTRWVRLTISRPLSTFLSSAVNKYCQHQEKNFLEMPRIKPWGCWVRSKNATSVLCSPSSAENFVPSIKWWAKITRPQNDDSLEMSRFVILITTIDDWEHVTLWIIEGIICLGSYLILAAKNIDKLVISTKKWMPSCAAWG